MLACWRIGLAEMLTAATSRCSFDPAVGGLSTLTQDLTLCPSAQYTVR